MKATKFRPYLLAASIGAMTAPMHAGAETLHTVDVLGVYPNHVAGLVTDPKAAFVSYIEYANKALQNSGVNYRYNLVHVAQKNWSNDGSLGGAQLQSLAEDAAIRALREDYGADLVAGMVPSSNGYCGIGYLAPANSTSHTLYSYAKEYGYSLSGHSCGGRTMSHEMGHNMGLGHSPAQGSTGTVATWGRGWGVNSSFISIMAYQSDYNVYSYAGALQIHSNPTLSVCNGHACGQPISKPDGADAVQALNLASPQISQWFDAVIEVPANTPPVAVNDSASTDAEKTVTVNVLQNDSDPDNDALTLNMIGDPMHGTAVAKADGVSIAYTPETGFDGTDSFTYTVMDSRGAKAQAQVSVQVKPVVTEPPPGGGGGTDTNLVVNGGGELGKTGWSGDSGTKISNPRRARSGNKSIRVIANAGTGASVKLIAPFEANTTLKVSGWLYATQNDPVYVYLRARQNGVWKTQYMTALTVPKKKWTNFEVSRYIAGGEISDANLYFYFPKGTRRVFIDDLEAMRQ